MLLNLVQKRNATELRGYLRVQLVEYGCSYVEHSTVVSVERT